MTRIPSTNGDTRDTTLDTVGGMMVLYMIFMHCCQFTEMMDWEVMKHLQTIFVGFMAWFFFKSGMFHHEGQGAQSVMKRTLPKLLRPYVAFSVVGYFVYCVVLWSRGDRDLIHYTLSIAKSIVLTGSFGGAMPLWFLVTLFLVKTFSPLVVGKCKLGGVIACGLIGWCCSYVESGQLKLQPYYVFNFFPAMFFYGLGYILKGKQYGKLVFVLSAAVFVASFAYPSMVDFRVNHLTVGSYPLFLLYSLAAIVVFNNVAKALCRSLWPFTQIGRQSMFWYCAHWPLLLIINLLFRNMFHSLFGLPLLLATFSALIVLLAAIRPLTYIPRLKRLLGL